VTTYSSYVNYVRHCACGHNHLRCRKIIWGVWCVHFFESLCLYLSLGLCVLIHSIQVLATWNNVTTIWQHWLRHSLDLELFTKWPVFYKTHPATLGATVNNFLLHFKVCTVKGVYEDVMTSIHSPPWKHSNWRKATLNLSEDEENRNKGGQRGNGLSCLFLLREVVFQIKYCFSLEVRNMWPLPKFLVGHANGTKKLAWNCPLGNIYDTCLVI